MKKIIIHWTAGTGIPNQHEKKCYHYLVDAKGELHEGIFKPQDNENCYDGKYAKHTAGGNTNAIGFAFCGMRGFVSSSKLGEYPLTKIQCENGFKYIAESCYIHNIKINPESVLTHYEFGLKHPKTESYGKIDIIYLPPYPEVLKKDIGNFIRNKIQWYYNNITLS